MVLLQTRQLSPQTCLLTAPPFFLHVMLTITMITILIMIIIRLLLIFIIIMMMVTTILTITSQKIKDVDDAFQLMMS